MRCSQDFARVRAIQRVVDIIAFGIETCWNAAPCPSSGEPDREQLCLGYFGDHVHKFFPV